MKKIIVTLLVLISVLIATTPAIANNDEYTIVNDYFSVTQGEKGLKIPNGSIIQHLENGITNVFDKEGHLVLKTRDSEAKAICTQNGQKPATYIYEVPDGSIIDDTGNVVKISIDGKTILSIIYPIKSNTKTFVPPAPQGPTWVEDAFAENLNIDYFRSQWTVPYFGSAPGTSTVNFLFNGIGPEGGNAILQPVLQWNQASSHTWNAVACYVDVYGGTVYSSDISVSSGDRIRGTMYYCGNNTWAVNIWDMDTYSNTTVYAVTNRIGLTSNVAYWVLESYFVSDNNDVPSNTTFTDNTMSLNNQSVGFTVDKYINTTGFPMLDSLDVTWSGQTWITLHTDNN